MPRRSPSLKKRGQGRFIISMKPYRHDLKKLARRLRAQMTDAELKLWSRIRRKQIYGIQFYRQKPLLDFIVDFYAPAARLVIEVDGGQHFEPEHKARDALRDQRLENLGILVLRFDNLQVLQEIEAVVEHIGDVVERRLSLQ
jgi:very-short-patch-repair endonuclease